MLESLYRYSRVLARHLDEPAAEERDRYVEHCAAGGAARESVLHLASELLVVAQRVDINATRAISTEEIATAADRWVRHQRRRGRISTARYSRQRFVQVATDWLRFLGRLEPAPATQDPGAWVFRTNVTGDSGIVTGHSGERDRGDSGNVTADSGERDRRAGHVVGLTVYDVGTVLRMNQQRATLLSG
jgi:hypothetical protein